MASLLTGTYGLDAQQDAPDGFLASTVKGAAKFGWDVVKPVNLRQENTPMDAEFAGSGKEWYDWVNYGIDTGNTVLSFSQKGKDFVTNKTVANPKSRLGKMAVAGAQKLARPFAAGVADGSLVPQLNKFGWKGAVGNFGIGMGVQLASVGGEMLSEEYVRDDAGHRGDFELAGQLGDYDLQERISKAYSSSRRSDRQIKTVLNATATGATIGPLGAKVGAGAGIGVAALQGTLEDDGEFRSGDPKFLEENEKSNRQSRIDFIESVFKTPRGVVDPRQEDEATDMLIRDYLINSRKHPELLERMMPFIESLASRAKEESDSRGPFGKAGKNESAAQRILAIKNLMENGEFSEAYESLKSKYADNRKFSYPDIKK